MAERPRDRGASGPPPMPFVVGVNRSGTTLLRMMLDSHPELAIPPETHFVPDVISICGPGGAGGDVDSIVAAITGVREWGDFGISEPELEAALGALEALDAASVLRCFYLLCAERSGKPRVGDKTPAYGRSMTAIAAVLPEARFVHVIRDGRDVALSIRERSRVERPFGRIAGRWKRRIEDAREQAAQLGPRYLEVRYEALVSDPAPALRPACDLIGLAWDPAMTDYTTRAAERLEEMNRGLPASGDRADLSAERRMEVHERVLEPPDPSRIGRWRSEMSADERSEFEAVAGELLAELGYGN
jgi:hypothetical protein